MFSRTYRCVFATLNKSIINIYIYSSELSKINIELKLIDYIILLCKCDIGTCVILYTFKNTYLIRHVGNCRVKKANFTRKVLFAFPRDPTADFLGILPYIFTVFPLAIMFKASTNGFFPVI